MDEAWVSVPTVSSERSQLRVLLLRTGASAASKLLDRLGRGVPEARILVETWGPDVAANIREGPADVIVVESSGKGGEALEACRQLRGSSDTRSIPLLFVAGPGQQLPMPLVAGEAVFDLVVCEPVPDWVLASQVRVLDRFRRAEEAARDRETGRGGVGLSRVGEHEWTLHLLAILADSSETQELISKLTDFLRTRAGCDAVGIRFKDGLDFPYCETRGFPAEFVQSECQLCSRDPEGVPICEPSGEVALDCLCGHVLRGRGGSPSQWFTEHGSFWTEDYRAFVARAEPGELPARMRCRCATEGYRSVALIPLNHGGETLGLLQLNDHRPGRFSREFIAFLEGSADQITLALRQRQLAAALRASEQRFRAVVDNSQAGYFRGDLSGRLVTANHAFLRMHGYDHLEEIIGLHFSDLVGEVDGPLAVDIARRLIVEESVVIGDFARRCRDGSTGYHSMSAQPVREGGVVIGCEGFVFDTTERRRAEIRLRRHAELLDAANDAIYVVGLDGSVSYCNAAAGRFHELPAESGPRRRLDELMGVDGAILESAATAVLLDDLWTGEIRVRSRAGREATLLCRWSVLRNSSGEPEAILAIHADITEHKRLESQFLRAQRLEGIGALASGIAHDLNNILAPVLMIAPLLREMASDAEKRSLVNTVEGCARRGAEIVGQLLAFARGKPEARVSLPVRHLLVDTHKLIRATFPRDIEIHLEFAADLWPVMGDATQIHQAVMNLCVNARDAMPDGGALTLVASNVKLIEADEERIPGVVPGPYVCIQVIDSGMGIDSTDRDRIFDPFFTTKEPGKGTGLGLPTVLSIVKGHEGFVRVDNRSGGGTTFELYFPADMAIVAPVPAEPEGAPRARGRGEWVLLVEDEEALNGTIRRALERHGYRVHAASRGDEALTLFTRHQAEIAVVLTDMMMPGMGGAAMLRSLRSIRPGFIAVGMTGLPDKMMIRGLNELGLVTLLRKPFTGDQLLRAVADALQSKDSPDAVVSSISTP